MTQLAINVKRKFLAEYLELLACGASHEEAIEQICISNECTQDRVCA